MCETDPSIRRSHRQRNVRSARQLLGFAAINVIQQQSNDNAEMSQTQQEDNMLQSETSSTETGDVTCDPAQENSNDTSCVPETCGTVRHLKPVTSDDLSHMRRSRSGRAGRLHGVIVDSELQSYVNNIESTDCIEDHVVFRTSDSQSCRPLWMFCKYCDAAIMHKHAFRKHIRQHPEIDYRPFHCPLCDYRATVRAQIVRHINIHGRSKPFVCTKCGRDFNFKQKLLTHMKYHDDVRDEQCPICSVRFHEFKTLKNHLTKVHLIDNVKGFLGRGSKRYNQVKQPPPTDGEECCKNELSNDNGDAGVLTTWECKQSSSEAAILLSESAITTSDNTTNPFVVNASLPTIAEADAIIVESHDFIVINGVHYRASVVSNEHLPSDSHLLNIVSAEYSPHSELAETTDSSQQAGTDAPSETGHWLLLKPDLEGLTCDDEMTKRCRRKGFNYDTPKTRQRTEKYQNGECKKSTTQRRPQVCQQRLLPDTDSDISDVINKYCILQHNSELADCSMFSCKLCESDNCETASTFRSKTQFVRHLESAHPDVKAWQCQQCSFQCHLRTTLIVHKKRHTAHKSFVCDTCGKGFAFKNKFVRHMHSHENAKQFRCHLCQKGFNELTLVRRHIERIHVEGLPYVCHVCDRGFKSVSNLHQHLESHYTIRRFFCDTCRKFYKTKSSFAQHIKFHSTLFRCDICNKDFSSYSGFMSHKVMHMESPAGYQCTLCNKVLLTKGSMKRHYEVVHNGARPFKCNLCHKAFKTKKDLQSHGVVHNTAKCFMCIHCEFKCKRMQSLQMHMRTHDNVKPYHCQYCDKQYTQKQSLDIHLSRHAKQLLSSSLGCDDVDEKFLAQPTDDCTPESLGYLDDKQLVPVAEAGDVYTDSCADVALDHVFIDNNTGPVPANVSVINDDECVYDVVTVEVSDADATIVS